MPRGESQAVVQQHLSEIHQWRAEGVPQREIARRLGLPESSLRGALKTLPTEVDHRIPTQPRGSDARVYEGIPPSPEAIQALEEARSLLPTLREMIQSWGVLQAMIAAYAQRQQLQDVAPQYRPYDGFFSCRLSHQLIRDIKAYAAEHRLSQSELVTMALQAYMRQP